MAGTLYDGQRRMVAVLINEEITMYFLSRNLKETKRRAQNFMSPYREYFPSSVWMHF